MLKQRSEYSECGYVLRHQNCMQIACRRKRPSMALLCLFRTALTTTLAYKCLGTRCPVEQTDRRANTVGSFSSRGSKSDESRTLSCRQGIERARWRRVRLYTRLRSRPRRRTRARQSRKLHEVVGAAAFQQSLRVPERLSEGRLSLRYRLQSVFLAMFEIIAAVEAVCGPSH